VCSSDLNNLNFPCAVKNCLAAFSSNRNFVRHVSKQRVDLPTVVEKSQRANATAKLRCSLTLCKEQFSDLLHLIKHLKQHRDNSLSVACPYKNCAKLFKVKSSFSAHLS